MTNPAAAGSQEPVSPKALLKQGMEAATIKTSRSYDKAEPNFDRLSPTQQQRAADLIDRCTRRGLLPQLDELLTEGLNLAATGIFTLQLHNHLEVLSNSGLGRKHVCTVNLLTGICTCDVNRGAPDENHGRRRNGRRCAHQNAVTIVLADRERYDHITPYSRDLQ